MGTITDNDGGDGNGVEISDITISEEEGTSTVTVTLTGNVQGGFTVDYATSDHTALNSDDYTATSGTLTFDGTDGESYTIEVPITNDLQIEQTESLIVNLSNLTTDLIGYIGDDNQGEITIIDHDVNIEDDTITIIDGVATNIDILANDSFSEDDIIQNIAITDISFGELTLNSNNIVTHTSTNPTNYETVTFTYTVTLLNSDGSIDELTGMVTINFLLTPITTDDLAETEANIPVDIAVLENDIDIGGVIDINTLDIIYEPENGTVFINADGSVTYAPDIDFIGDDVFTYEVCDDSGLCNTADVTVIVAGVLGVDMVIPEGFSPNGDGVHDVFYIKSLSNLYPDFQLVIYNRWGNVVYDYKHNGNPLSEPIWWDGYSSGRMTVNSDKQVPVGTYFYSLYYNKDDAKPRSGYVYLNR